MDILLPISKMSYSLNERIKMYTILACLRRPIAHHSSVLQWCNRLEWPELLWHSTSGVVVFNSSHCGKKSAFLRASCATVIKASIIHFYPSSNIV